jgi:hypothetical protein
LHPWEKDALRIALKCHATEASCTIFTVASIGERERTQKQTPVFSDAKNCRTWKGNFTPDPHGYTSNNTLKTLLEGKQRECVLESRLKITPNFSFAMFACEKRYIWPSLLFPSSDGAMDKEKGGNYLSVGK